MITQLIMLSSLLFSPITFPPGRLSDWMGFIYRPLPFVPMSNLLRSTLFSIGIFDWSEVFVVAVWGVVGFGFSVLALAKKS